MRFCLLLRLQKVFRRVADTGLPVAVHRPFIYQDYLNFLSSGFSFDSDVTIFEDGHVSERMEEFDPERPGVDTGAEQRYTLYDKL